jgi:hypothetical protein
LIRKLHILCLAMLTPVMMKGQYISEVWSYLPAPGQFINSAPWGLPSSAASLVGGVDGHLCLGAFGGSVVFRFEQPVENHPDNPYGVDFTIFGNPMGNWSEPGVVWVMQDQNGNGLPDDTWYELAGSDYHFSSSVREYEVTYFDPGRDVTADVAWKDAEGLEGFIRANDIHLQSYYPLADSFPELSGESYSLAGSRIRGFVDVDSPPVITSSRRAFGYADNQMRGSASHVLPDNPYTPEVENSGGDAFDIGWAVDEQGLYVELDRVDFIRVQNAILHEGGYLGEISTDLCGAVDVEPAPGAEGSREVLVLADLPPRVDTGSYELEVILFSKGRPLDLPGLLWECSAAWATVEDDHLLRLNGEGSLELRVTSMETPELSAVIRTTVTPGISTGMRGREAGNVCRIYPNPAGDYFRVEGAEGATLRLFSPEGKLHLRVDNYAEGRRISTETLLPGLYLLLVESTGGKEWIRFIRY